MFARMMTGKIKESRHASAPFDCVEGERITISYDERGRPFMTVYRSRKIEEELPVYGDVYLMNHAGDTISCFRPPLNFVGRDADGWKSLGGTDRTCLSESPAAGPVPEDA